MAISIKGEKYYRTSEACNITGVCRSTLLRWFKDNTIKDVSHRDRRGWRLFTEADIERIKAEAEFMQ